MNGNVLANRNRRHVVLNGYVCGTGALVASGVDDSQGHRVSSYVGTVEGGRIGEDGVDYTVVGASTIHISGGDGCISGWVQLHGNVLTDCIRCFCIQYRNIEGTDGDITTFVVGGCGNGSGTGLEDRSTWDIGSDQGRSTFIHCGRVEGNRGTTNTKVVVHSDVCRAGDHRWEDVLGGDDLGTRSVVATGISCRKCPGDGLGIATTGNRYIIEGDVRSTRQW